MNNIDHKIGPNRTFEDMVEFLLKENLKYK